MKLKNKVQRVLESLIAICFTALIVTIDNKFNIGYLAFELANIGIMVCSGIILTKYGRYE